MKMTVPSMNPMQPLIRGFNWLTVSAHLLNLCVSALKSIEEGKRERETLPCDVRASALQHLASLQVRQKEHAEHRHDTAR